MAWNLYDSLDLAKKVIRHPTSKLLGEDTATKIMSKVDSMIDKSRQHEMDKKWELSLKNDLHLENELKKKHLAKEEFQRQELVQNEQIGKEGFQRQEAIQKEQMTKEEFQRQEAIQKEQMDKEEFQRQEAIQKEQMTKEEFQRQEAIQKEQRTKDEIQALELIGRDQVIRDRFFDHEASKQGVQREEDWLKSDKTIKERAEGAENQRLDFLENQWQKEGKMEFDKKIGEFNERHKQLGTDVNELEKLSEVQEKTLKEIIQADIERKRGEEIERQKIVGEQQRKMEIERNDGRFR